MYPKFLIFKLPSVSNKDALSILKKLLRGAINDCDKKLQHVLKEFSVSENFISRQLSIIDFYMLKSSIYNITPRCGNCYIPNAENIITDKRFQLPIFTANKTITNLSQEEADLLKAVYIFPFNQIKFENLKSSLHSKRFIVLLLTTLNPRKPKAYLSYLANSYFYYYKPSPCIVGHYRLLQNLKKKTKI